ncbi:MAG: dihydrofolate reductase, partial [Propionibacteriaceae bacterium]|nr:dihydrofolate reductase [Propionibacteriaceae bacterium]
ADLVAHLGPIPAGIEVDFLNQDRWTTTGSDRVEYIANGNFDMVTMRAVFRADLPSLRWFQLASAGHDYMIDDFPSHLGLLNAAGVHDTGTAELALTLALSHLNGLGQYHRDWSEGRFEPRYGRTLADRRVLLVGYGHIGQAIEQRLAGFEIASLTRVAQRRRDDPLVHPVTDLMALLPTADVVFMTLPATPDTYHLFDGAALAQLPDGALIVNVGRGNTIDTEALLTQLGRIEAAVDVTDPEPLPAGHPLWGRPDVTWTPHVGGHSGAFFSRYDRLLRQQLARLAAGQEPLNIVRYPA